MKLASSVCGRLINLKNTESLDLKCFNPFTDKKGTHP